MKKLLIIGMAFMLSLSMVGCGGSKSSNGATEVAVTQESKTAINSSLNTISANFAFYASVIVEKLCAASISINGSEKGTTADIVASFNKINAECHGEYGVPDLSTLLTFKREITIGNVEIHAYSNGEFVANGTFTIVDKKFQDGKWVEVYTVTKTISVKFVKNGTSYVMIEFKLV